MLFLLHSWAPQINDPRDGGPKDRRMNGRGTKIPPQISREFLRKLPLHWNIYYPQVFSFSSCSSSSSYVILGDNGRPNLLPKGLLLLRSFSFVNPQIEDAESLSLNIYHKLLPRLLSVRGILGHSTTNPTNRLAKSRQALDMKWTQSWNLPS